MRGWALYCLCLNHHEDKLTAQPMSQDPPKLRKRDKFRTFLGIQPSSRSVSPNPRTPSPSGSKIQDSAHPTKHPRKTFKRTSSLEKDLAVLSTTYLLQGNPKLRDLIVLIVRLRERDEDNKVSMTIAF